jgi:uncharacterized protein (TIGR02186 family)
LVFIIGLFCISDTNTFAYIKVKSIIPSSAIIGTTYNGVKINIKGEISKNEELIIKVIGHKRDTHFKKKGKIWGILWMNIDDVVFTDLPSLYLVYTGDIPESMIKKMGFASLRKEIKITSSFNDKNFLFNELIKLKRKEGLYCVRKDAIKYKKLDSKKEFDCSVFLPAKLLPGTYQIKFIAIKNGKIAENITLPLQARLEGLPKLISYLAFQHSTIYGIMAVLIAIIAGLIMGIIFKGGKGSH